MQDTRTLIILSYGKNVRRSSARVSTLDWFCGNKDGVTVLGFIRTMVETNVFGWAEAMSRFAAV
jgi:hypothetical protein